MRLMIYIDNIYEPDEISCQHYEENELTLRTCNGDDFLYISSTNMRRLPKHGSELSCFFNLMTTKIDVLVWAGIEAKDITLVKKSASWIHILLYDTF